MLMKCCIRIWMITNNEACPGDTFFCLLGSDC